jgi:toxin FitB
MLIDSNIIIYSARPEYPQIRQFIAEHNPSVSALSYVEVLGYHQLTEGDRLHFEEFFRHARIIAISTEVIEQAAVLRRQRRMTLGDAIIAATAIVYGLTLVTRNSVDFQWIAELLLLNPFEAELGN